MKHADIPLMQSLIAHISLQVGLPSTSKKAPIDTTFANYAIKRHRVGPFLYAVAKHSQNLDEQVAASLLACYQKNMREILVQTAVLQRLSRLFETHGIEFSVLKGAGFADQVYDEPMLRCSKDIDILIPTHAAEAAIQLLSKNGFILNPYSIREDAHLTQKRQLSDMELFKDLTFFDPKLGVIIELHQRLFMVEPSSLTADFNSANKFQKIPSINDSHYCLYIILHGAVSSWFRLKWVMDVSLLVRKISVPERRALMEVAKIYGCENAVSASLWFAEEIFACTLDDEWAAILEEYSDSGEVAKLVALFRQALLTTSFEQPDMPARRSRFFDIYTTVFTHRVSIFDVVVKRAKVRLLSVCNSIR